MGGFKVTDVALESGRGQHRKSLPYAMSVTRPGANRGLGPQMTDLTEKEELLEDSGYRYHFVRMMYFNRAFRRVLRLLFYEFTC